ncbi:branched-chain amino acid ABC transporter permease [Amycolatopsis sp. NPDC051903]|uniref:branched-chain amino acid ABC transporter permease n=1 Tax=Amycolatopsis sp. NPDC051903 TaxID=3363936 RepID=UPI00379E7E85
MTTVTVPRRVRAIVRDSALPVEKWLGRVRVTTPATVTSPAGEKRYLGSPWTTAGVVLVAVVVAGWAGVGGAYVQTVVGLFGAYLVSALGYTVVLGQAGQFAFCQNAFMALGAYGYAISQPRFGPVAGLLIGAAAATVAGTIIGCAIIRTRDLYLALLTLAFSQAALLAIQLWPPTQGDNGILVDFGGDQAYLLAVVFATVALIVVQRMTRSKIGRAFALVRTDEKAAATMGVNVPVTRMLAFAFSSLLGGLGGVLLGAVLTFITPTNFTLELTLLLLTMIVIGGVGSVWGAVTGVLIMVVVQQFLPSSGSFGSYLNAGLLFVILVLRPGGLRSLVNLRSTGGRRG